MTLKQLVDVGEQFPKIKRSRLGAAPPVEDVLNNVGAPEITAPAPQIQVTVTADPLKDASVEEATRPKLPRKKEGTAKRVGQGVHKGSGTDARRYRKSGRIHQFGARVRPEYAEAVKVTAASKNVTIGELLEEMRNIYDSINSICTERKMSVADVLGQLRKAS